MATKNKTLSLYHYQACPFCHITRRTITSLKMDIELRNIQQNQQHRQALRFGGGKSQVPCLRIDTNDGSTRWLYESRDIIEYLKKNAA